ncbi:MAG TPA: metal-dependent hydrolase [Methanoregulaceae archaeon]|nr:metal-dependent hydrolase [Methanoregulaceae archaeon]
MITRHHISLAIGSIIILYFPLISTNPVILASIGAGVCAGVVIPDIQMKKPRRFNALSLAWCLVQVFKRSILRLYVSLHRNVTGIRAEADDKRLTHSLPGLFFLVGVIGISILCITWVFPFGYPVHFLRVFLAGIIIGLILHILEDSCTKKGLCLFFPFSETWRISGSIRPCNTDDTRICLFHIQAGLIIIAVTLVNYTGFCPEYLKWALSISALILFITLMLYHAEIRIIIPDSFESNTNCQDSKTDLLTTHETNKNFVN